MGELELETIGSSFHSYALYDDSRVAADLLRFHTALVLRQSVREIVSPATLFARNYITNSDECVVRMTQLHLNPWIAMYVSPKNAIVLDENFPLIPAELADTWKTPVYDRTQLNYNNPRNSAAIVVDREPSNAIGGKLAPYEIAPITASSIVIPESNLAILNYGDTPEQLRLDNTDAEENFCMRDVKLNLAINTVNDFGAADMNAKNVNGVAQSGPKDILTQLTEPRNNDNSNNNNTTLNAVRPEGRDDFMSFLRTF